MSLMLVNPYRFGSPAACDPFYASVISLLLFNGTPGMTTSDEIVGNTWTINTPAQVTDAGSLSRAGWNGYFDNTSILFNTGYLASNVANNYQLGTGDFTIDFWMNPSATSNLTGTRVLLYSFSPGYASDVQIYLQGATSLRYFGNGADRITAAVTWNDNQWYHIAVCRASGTTRMFVDGVQVGSSYADSLNYTNTKVNWGSLDFFAGGQLVGALDDCRITTAARYTSNFTPPDEEVPAIAC